jgi:hypothetical protein
MLYGTAFGLIVNDAIPSHVVQAILNAHGLAHMFGVGGAPLILP